MRGLLGDALQRQAQLRSFIFKNRLECGSIQTGPMRAHLRVLGYGRLQLSLLSKHVALKPRLKEGHWANKTTCPMH